MHTVPAICALVIMVTSNCVLIKRHSVTVVYIGGVYTSMNCVVTKIRGQPIYHFLRWDDWNSYVISVVGSLVAAAGYYCIAKFD